MESGYFENEFSKAEERKFYKLTYYYAIAKTLDEEDSKETDLEIVIGVPAGLI